MLNRDGKCLTMTHFVCNTKLRFDFWILYHILSSLNWWICWKEGVKIWSFSFWNLAYNIISSFLAVFTLKVVFNAEASLFTMSLTLTWTRLEAGFTLGMGFFSNRGSLECFCWHFCKILQKNMHVSQYFQSEMSSGWSYKCFLFFTLLYYRGS